jgi:tetratricopeptide (TPR) repeat protein
MAFHILKRFWWIIVVLFASPVINTFAQEVTPEPTPSMVQDITLLLTGDVRPSAGFLQSFENWTNVSGHTVQIITEAAAAADPEVRPLLSLTFEEENRSVHIELLVHPLRERSPILMDLPEPAVVNGSTEIQAIITAVYALYAAGTCEEAMNLAQTMVAQDADVTTGQTFNPLADVAGFRRLLGWNCLIQEYDEGKILLIAEINSPNTDPLLPELDIAITVNLAWLFLDLQNPDPEFSKLDALAERWRDDPYAIVEIMRKRSQFHALVNDFDSAMNVIERAIDLATGAFSKPDLAPLYIQRGQVHTLLYEWDNAIFDYTTAINFAPDNEAVAEAYYYRGFIYYTTLFDRERALPDFERYLELAPYGDHREEAMQYRQDIQAELDALSD